MSVAASEATGSGQSQHESGGSSALFFSHPVTDFLRRHLVAIDVVVAVVLAALWFAELAGEPSDRAQSVILGYVLAAGATLPLAVRRLSPDTVFATMAICFAFALLNDSASTGVGVALAAYTVLADRSRREGLVVVVASYLLIVLAYLTLPGTTMSNLFFDAITFAMVIAIAELVRTRRAYAQIYAERAAKLEADKSAAAQRAVDAERLRIARELHDVVAHAISLIAVQSSVGLDRLRSDPKVAEEALATIETGSRTALGEMRRMLGILRHGDDSVASLTPSPGLDGVPELVSEASNAGIDVSLVVEGTRPATVPPGVDLCGYRIVQEALTNVVKHAAGSAASVTVRWEADVVVIQVADDGHGPGLLNQASSSVPHGLGLVGMSERVALFGGELTVGPRPSGGFAITAHLPFGQAPGQSSVHPAEAENERVGTL